MPEQPQPIIPINALKHVTASQVVHKGPALLISVCMSGDGAAADCDIYDGHNIKMEKKIHLEAISGTTCNFPPPANVKFNYGIYVVVNAATTNLMIVYQPLEA